MRRLVDIARLVRRIHRHAAPGHTGQLVQRALEDSVHRMDMLTLLAAEREPMQSH